MKWFFFLVAVLAHWGCACADMNGLDLRQATVHVHHINNSNAMLDAAAEDGRPAHWTVYLDAYCAEPKKRRQQLCKMDWRRDGANPCFFSHKGGGVHCLPLWAFGCCPKAGTSSMWKYIVAHPQHQARQKELMYYKNMRGSNLDIQPYSSMFVEVDRASITGDGTPGIKAQIFEIPLRNVVPWLRVVFLVRRLANLYWSTMFYVGNVQRNVPSVFKSKHEVYLGKFYEELQSESSSLRAFVLKNNLVGTNCDYAARIDTMFASGYRREQVLFVKLETMKENMENVYEFLGLPPYPLDAAVAHVYNKGHYWQQMTPEIDAYLMDVLLKPCVDKMKERVPEELTRDW
jgi:hypothetical protein